MNQCNHSESFNQMTSGLLIMPLSPLTGFTGLSFDMGGTLLQDWSHSAFEAHKRFIQQVCGDEYSFSDEEIDTAVGEAERGMWDHYFSQGVDVHWFPSEDVWIWRNKEVLKKLGVRERIDERAVEYEDLWVECLKDNPMALKPEAADILEALSQRGYKLGVATNWYDPSGILRTEGVLDLFQSIQFSVVTGYSKPSPYMLIMNAYEMGVNPLKCAFVGDDIKRDIEAAKRAGMKPILIVENPIEEPDVEEDVIVIKELIELLEIFQ